MLGFLKIDFFRVDSKKFIGFFCIVGYLKTTGGLGGGFGF